MEIVLAQGLLEPNTGLVIWKLLAFGIFLGILYKFAWGPITDALQDRENTIDSSMRRAEDALAEAKKIQADNQKARREAEQEAQRILRETREEAEKLRAEEAEKTRAKMEQMQEQARKEIRREKQAALDDLRAEVADLAIMAAGKIIDDQLDDKRQRHLVDNFLEDLPQN